MRSQSMIRSMAAIGALTAGAAGLGGCFSYSAGARDRMQAPAVSIAADAWPARDTREVERFREVTPAEIYLFERDPGWTGGELPPDAAELIEAPALRVVYNEMTGQGLLRVYEEPGEIDEEVAAIEIVMRGFVRQASFLSDGRSRSAGFASSYRRAQRRLNRLRPPHPGLRAIERKPTMLADGIGIGFPPIAVSRPKGVLLHFTALMGNSYERAVVDGLEERGWAVVHIETRTRVEPPNLGKVMEAHERRDDRRDELLHASGTRLQIEAGEEPGGKLTFVVHNADAYADAYARASRQAAAEVPIPASGFEPATDSDEDIDDAAQRIAAAVDDALAENAYAAEAAMLYIEGERPDLAGLPVAVIGFSAGALAAPTAAVRLGDRVDAVVLIGGGANVFTISQMNSLTRGGIELSRDGKPLPRRVLDRISERYLVHSRLDPYHAAMHLRGLPVLTVHAVFDRIVPASTGKLLYERLGRPDRLAFMGGHMGLFYLLEGQVDRIARWLDDNVGRDEDASGRVSEGSSPLPETPGP